MHYPLQRLLCRGPFLQSWERSEGKMGQPDIVEKYLESYPDVFADIVNVLIFKGEQRIHPEQLSDAEPGGMYKCDGKLHENRRDVAKFVCSNKDGEVDVHIALIGIENQTNVFYLMPVRCFEYDAANYRKQLTATKDLGKKASDKVIPIVTLVLYFGKSPWTGPTTLKQCLDKKKYTKEFEPYLNDYKIHVFDIPRLSEKQVDMFQSDFRIAADYFRKRIMGRTNFIFFRAENPFRRSRWG